MGVTEAAAVTTTATTTLEADADTAIANTQLTLDTFRNIFMLIEPDVQIDACELAQGSGRGDNYTATLYRIRLTGLRKSTAEGKKQKWEKSLICKALPENAQRREAYKSDKLFRNEIKFYTRIMPELLKFQASKAEANSATGFNALPKCYYAHDDLLIMEDLRVRGFKMPDRTKGLTIEEMQAVLLQVAQFHALSLSYKFEHPKKFEQLVGVMGEGIFCTENTSWYKNYYERLTKNAIKMVADVLPEDSKYLCALRQFAEGSSFFASMVHLASAESPLSAICHGDCWVNNFLYRYELSGHPQHVQVEEVALVDFQLIRFSSIALDIANLIFCCTSKQMRDAHLAMLLKLYTCELYKWMTLLCTQLPDYCDTLDKFESLFAKELKSYGRFALGIALDIIPISTCLSEDAPDLYRTDETVDEFGAPELNFPPNDLCRQKLAEIVIDMVDGGML